MQEQNAHDPEVQYAFSKSFARVMSVARVHDRLYQSEKVEAVDLGQTIEALCRDLGEMAGEDREITVTASPALMVPYGKAVPLALITTELVTNALKYAYASNEPGHIGEPFAGAHRRHAAALLRPTRAAECPRCPRRHRAAASGCGWSMPCLARSTPG